MSKRKIPVELRSVSYTHLDGTKVSGFTETTVGLLIFNENIPQDLGFIDRSKAENALKFEVELSLIHI